MASSTSSTQDRRSRATRPSTRRTSVLGAIDTVAACGAGCTGLSIIECKRAPLTSLARLEGTLRASITIFPAVAALYTYTLSPLYKVSVGAKGTETTILSSTIRETQRITREVSKTLPELRIRYETIETSSVPMSKQVRLRLAEDTWLYVSSKK